MRITQLLGEVFLTNERLIWYKESSGLQYAVQIFKSLSINLFEGGILCVEN
jgi:hypothetical protein